MAEVASVCAGDEASDVWLREMLPCAVQYFLPALPMTRLPCSRRNRHGIALEVEWSRYLAFGAVAKWRDDHAEVEALELQLDAALASPCRRRIEEFRLVQEDAGWGIDAAGGVTLGLKLTVQVSTALPR